MVNTDSSAAVANERNTISKWAGMNIPMRGANNPGETDTRFRRSKDHVTDWTNAVLGKGYVHKHSGHEMSLKTANLVQTNKIPRKSQAAKY